MVRGRIQFGWGGPLVVSLLSFAIFACSSGGSALSEQVARLKTPPPEQTQGEQLFESNCAPCHGKRAAGTDRGPTFLSKIYAADHHADIAFERAPQNGVRAHHWTFGDMPKISGVTAEDVKIIIAYIRWLQAEAVAAGIY
jgi:mono/diheme cytochrome c family protein